MKSKGRKKGIRREVSAKSITDKGFEILGGQDTLLAELYSVNIEKTRTHSVENFFRHFLFKFSILNTSKLSNFYKSYNIFYL